MSELTCATFGNLLLPLSLLKLLRPLPSIFLAFSHTYTHTLSLSLSFSLITNDKL